MRAIQQDLIDPVEGVDPGAVPNVQWLAIDDLVVDDSYQRSIDRRGKIQIKKIAESFSWHKFQTVEVAPVEGGQFAIIDGQHRTHAALACGIKSVPCRICPMDHKGAAEAFAAMNGDVQPITTFHVFKAALVAETPWAVEADEVVRDAGGRLRRSNQALQTAPSGDIFCIQLIRGRIERHGALTVRTALSLVLKTPLTETPDMRTSRVLEGVIAMVADRPHFLPLAAALRGAIEDGRIDVEGIFDRAATFIRDRKKTGMPCLSIKEQFASDLGSRFDRVFPQRMAIAS